MAGYVRALLRDASACGSAGEVEVLASDVAALMGNPEFGEQLGIGAHDVIAELGRSGGPGAFVLLRGLAYVDGGALGDAARDAAERLRARDRVAPAWSDLIGGARAVQAWLVRDDDFDDGAIVFVEFAAEHGPYPLLAVFVDHNAGGAASHVHVCRSMPELVTVVDAMPGDAMKPSPISLEDAAARVRDALATTPPEMSAETMPGVTNLYALARARLAALPDTPPRARSSEISPDERFMLLEGFLESDEGAPFRDDLDAQTAVARAIDFCADHVDGRPLRWSPTVVEMFVVDWLPAHDGDRRMLDGVPAALRAWIAYAGRLRGLAEELIEETVEAVDLWADEVRAMGQAGGASSAA